MIDSGLGPLGAEDGPLPCVTSGEVHTRQEDVESYITKDTTYTRNKEDATGRTDVPARQLSVILIVSTVT